MKEELNASRSSWIVGAEWDDETLEMTIDLGYKGTFQYSGLPRDVWEAWKRAPSLGRYYRLYIRGHYA